jgi:hypothetical protein
MTGSLNEFIRKAGAAFWQSAQTVPHAPIARTIPGIGPGGWDKHALANAQGQAPADSALLKTKTVYRVYTENLNSRAVTEIIGRYFEGATITKAIGLDARTQGASESAIVIEIITSKVDALQRIAFMAQDIRTHNAQISVLVSRATVDTFEVTENV